ncbi:MAG TPA: mandelate racemase/muconate lactonizing enzyme family protein, partial [Candidatus Binatia bacterium]
MKITDVRAIRLRAVIPADGQVTGRSGLRNFRAAALVRVETDAGIAGLGSCSGNGAVVKFILEEVIKPAVVGMDPTDIDSVWQKIYFGPRARQLGLRGIGFVALSGLDVALWDIRGQAEKVPVYKLLGGLQREQVDVYATALYPDETPKVVERAVAFAERGFKGIKIKLGFDLEKDMERVGAVRAAVGDAFPLMTDANMGYDLDQAVEAASRLEQWGVGWLEEPLFFADVAGHRHLKTRTNVPIALGENLHTHYDFEQFIARGAIDILQPDVARAGGFSEIARIAALAETHGLPVSLHTWGDGVALAASLHLAAALKNSIVMELDST